MNNILEYSDLYQMYAADMRALGASDETIDQIITMMAEQENNNMIMTDEQKEIANKYLIKYAELYAKHGQEMIDAGVTEDMIDYELNKLIEED